MSPSAHDIAERLAARAEDVCRYYLSNGRRAGNYWQVGSIANEPGQSLFVRLKGPLSGRGASGRWTDAATGEHGDLLDLIRLAKGLASLAETLKEAMDFLNMAPSPTVTSRPLPPPRPDEESVAQAQRLFGLSKPLKATLAETYLKGRGIHIRGNYRALRFHPSCYVQNGSTSEKERWPALIAAITDGDGNITAVQRTFLNRNGEGKAPFENPRRSLGLIQGQGIRLGRPKDCLAVGEGLETMLSLRQLLPEMAVIATTSAAHATLLQIPSGVRRLYVASDRDEAGDHAAEMLTKRMGAEDGCQTMRLRSVKKDFNDDVCQLSSKEAHANLAEQMAEEDLHYLGR